MQAGSLRYTENEGKDADVTPEHAGRDARATRRMQTEKMLSASMRFTPESAENLMQAGSLRYEKAEKAGKDACATPRNKRDMQAGMPARRCATLPPAA
jgi:hypothetical protein